ncbi:MFS transporter [Sphingobium sp. YR768]|uniref:MFS transporter n=1 Tax=Sphingobium sp. YR768 TaxID=1884365 RepID=UPI0008D070E7|nr:MFS transporter [Sphingobium sp. YR768]SER34432.1 drug resistance transporter, EmrB/QacA subfamily [Sphingobium sp. YR768]
MTALTADAAQSAASLSPAQRRAALGTLIIAFVVDVLDGTIVNVAVPAIRSDLHASALAVQWIVAGYALAFGMLLISGGRLGDLYGYRRLFLTGIIGFSLSSVACGLADDALHLVLARIAQGATAALMAPQVLALIQLLYGPSERVGVLGMFGLLGGVSAILGPIVGGALIDANIAGLGWRPIFFINAPLGVAGVIAALKFLPVGRSAHPLRMDWTGNALVIATLFALIFPLAIGRDLGWPLWCVALLVATLPLVWTTLRYLKARTARDGSALLDPALFRQRSFGLGVIASLIFATATSGLLLTMMLVLQIGLGMDPLTAGVAHIPFAIGAGLGVGFIGRGLVPKLGRNVLVLGAACMIAGIVALVPVFAAGGPATPLALALLMAGLGMGMLAGPLTPIALARIDRAHAGAAGGVLKAVQQLGSAIGAAGIGALFLWLAKGAQEAEISRQAFTATAGAMVALLLIVALLARMLPARLFDA